MGDFTPQETDRRFEGENSLKSTYFSTYTFPAVSVTAGNTVVQSQTIAHGIGTTTGFIPGFNAFVRSYNALTAPFASFPTTYYVPLIHKVDFGDSVSGLVANSVFVGIDQTNLYFSRSIFNADSISRTASAVPVKYYILQQAATSS